MKVKVQNGAGDLTALSVDARIFDKFLELELTIDSKSSLVNLNQVFQSVNFVLTPGDYNFADEFPLLTTIRDPLGVDTYERLSLSWDMDNRREIQQACSFKGVQGTGSDCPWTSDLHYEWSKDFDQTLFVIRRPLLTHFWLQNADAVKLYADYEITESLFGQQGVVLDQSQGVAEATLSFSSHNYHVGISSDLDHYSPLDFENE